jgi:hypothetical protein
MDSAIMQPTCHDAADVASMMQPTCHDAATISSAQWPAVTGGRTVTLRLTIQTVVKLRTPLPSLFSSSQSLFFLSKKICIVVEAVRTAQ